MNMSENIKNRRKSVLIGTIDTILFSFILYHVYGSDAWQFNIMLIIFLLISCYTESPEKWKIFYKKHKVRLILLDFLLAFCLIGNRLYVFPLNKSISLSSIIIFLLFALACTPIIVFVYSLPQKKCCSDWITDDKDMDRKTSVRHLLAYIAIPIIIGMASIFALNPCIVSYDAFEVIAEAKGLTPIQDYAGVPYVLWFKLLLSLIDSPSFLCIVQIFIYAFVIGYFLFVIEKEHNIKFGVLLVVLLLYSVLPNNIMMMITLSKDVYYAIFLCLMMIALMHLIKEEERASSYAFLGSTYFLVWSIRQSGIVVVLFVIFASVFFLKKKKALALTGLIAIICSLGFNASLVQLTNAEPIHGGMKYIALYQDILGVYYSGGSVSDDTLKLIEKGVGDNPEFKDKYTPYWAYYDYYYPELEDEEMVEFLMCYLNTFIRNPRCMMNAILCRLDMMWDISPGVNAFESWQWSVENNGGSWTHLARERSENALTTFFNFVGEKSKEFPYKNFIWRVALWNITFIIFLFRMHDKRKFLIFSPFFGYIFAYMISLGWSHYRYYWADEMLMFMSYLYLIANEVGNKRIKLDTNDARL